MYRFSDFQSFLKKQSNNIQKAISNRYEHYATKGANALQAFKNDPTGRKAAVRMIKAKIARRRLNKAEAKVAATKFEDFKRENISPLEDRYQNLPEKAMWITTFAKNFVMAPINVAKDLKKEFKNGSFKSNLFNGLVYTIGFASAVHLMGP